MEIIILIFIIISSILDAKTIIIIKKQQNLIKIQSDLLNEYYSYIKELREGENELYLYCLKAIFIQYVNNEQYEDAERCKKLIENEQRKSSKINGNTS